MRPVRNPPVVRTVVGAFLLLWVLATSRAQDAPRFVAAEADLGRLVALIDRRLDLMDDVAAAKWHAKQPVYDATREEVVLEQTVRNAAALRIDPIAARRFFEVQIRMARAIQSAHFERWRTGTPPPPGRDLVTQLRPELDAIGAELLVAAYIAAPELERLDSTGATAALERHADARELLPELEAALSGLRLAGRPDLAAIRRAGVLRIGTTGDYAPFSSDAAGTLRGFDIQLGQALALHLGVKPRFVKTQWTTLVEDFRNGRFDIAMSGISVTDERRAAAEFSIPYHEDGKTPIVRCGDTARFANFERIDQPGVRVIVNPGGTNERFVRDRLKRAALTVHPDNRTIFDELLAGRADVMFTDGIEVQLQSLRHPQLCGPFAEPMTRTPKAILLPKDAAMKIVIDSWLLPQIEQGEIRLLLDRALSQAQ